VNLKGVEGCSFNVFMSYPNMFFFKVLNNTLIGI